MQVKMRVQISGTRDGVDWPAPGETIELPDHEAAELIALGLAEEATGEDSIEPAAEAGSRDGAEDPDGDGEPAGEPGSVDLEELTVSELRTLADERGVELGSASKKADIIAVLASA